jgi:hypothetical protein
MGGPAVPRGGRRGHVGYAARSAVIGRDRYDLGVHTSLEAAAARVSDFYAAPNSSCPALHACSARLWSAAVNRSTSGVRKSPEKIESD